MWAYSQIAATLTSYVHDGKSHLYLLMVAMHYSLLIVCDFAVVIVGTFTQMQRLLSFQVHVYLLKNQTQATKGLLKSNPSFFFFKVQQTLNLPFHLYSSRSPQLCLWSPIASIPSKLSERSWRGCKKVSLLLFSMRVKHNISRSFSQWKMLRRALRRSIGKRSTFWPCESFNQ